ncbi:response regulator [Roseospira marina]|uniref:response regulator n=1 Tax=Roseospira marina TaxID=140057 RepID=UPI00184E9B17|nr:response regulator [Roseospira marina]MBB4316024.1 two-component system chemotaxis response regulator CheY [Roseospira marina]MBB5089190.1 two-component system chemotaxis response regulator CheY [Roseospira marina]
MDDAVTVRMFHRNAVEALGHDVAEAENGIEGIETALTDPVDLMLVDINMPRMDGFRFLEEIRKTPELQGIPAVMVSTEAKPDDRLKAYACGANLYRVKPVKPADMKALLSLILGEPTA